MINGGIYTIDEKRSWAEAVAVIDGVFVAVGSNAEIEPMIGPETAVIDLTGSMALPGFHDAHVHPTMGGYALMGCMLETESSVDAIIQKVTSCAADGEDAWVQGHAFDLALFGQDGPDKTSLDAIDTERLNVDRQLFDIPATEISDAKVLMTMLDGELVYTAQ